MNIFKTIFSKIGWASLFIFSSTSSVFANHIGGHIVIGGGAPTAIPTLSGSMLILLSLLLFIVALRISKQKNAKVNKFFITLLGVGILSIGGSGIKLISNAQAGVDLPITLLSSPSGGASELILDLPSGFSFVDNNTAQALLILRFESSPPDLVRCSFSSPFMGQTDFCTGKTPPFSIPAGTQCSVVCSFIR